MITTTATKILQIYDLASQHDIESLDHARSACGITCLWMAIRYIDPSFTLSLQELHDEQRKLDWHFRPSDQQWLQHGGAKYARRRGLKAMAINLSMMGNAEEDIHNMLASGRITQQELKDYEELFALLHVLSDAQECLETALKYFIGKNVPVMIGVGPNFSNHKSNHRIVCTGYDNGDAVIVDPLDRVPTYKRESLKRMSEYSTGNILMVYKDKL